MATPADHRAALRLAHAVWLDLGAALQAYQAAVLRDGSEKADDLRARAHDLLDACLDHHASAAQVIKSILPD